MKQKPAVVHSILKAARAYLLRGFFVAPIPRGKNHPVLNGWQNLRLTEDELSFYFADAGGISLLLKPSKVKDVDLDCREAVVAADVLLPRTGMVHGRRGNPSSHRYFCTAHAISNASFTDPRVKSRESDRAMLVELRCNGQTVVPPSRHWRSGETIRWESDGKPAEIEADELLRDVAQVAAAALLARYWPTGSRHFAALALAGMLLRAGWTEKATKKFVLAVARAAEDEETASRLRDVVSTRRRLGEEQQVTGTPTLADLVGDDIVSKVREWLQLSVSVEDEHGSSACHNTDLGNARRLVALHGKNLHFCFTSGKFLVWAGSRWAPDETGEVQRLAKNTIQSVYSEASGLTDSAARAELAKHALKSEADSRIRAMVELAKTEPGIPVTSEQLDADPWLFNCLNGTVDLRTGKLLPHQRETLCTKHAPVAFDPRATCPIWAAFLDRIMAGNRPLIRFLQRAAGYSLTGITTEEVVFFLYGTGANGKTTFIETVRHFLGDYAVQADFDTFLVRRSDGPRNDLARLKGARFVAAIEAAQGRQLAENVIKQATGRDTIPARFLYREFFEYAPQFKLFLVANHKPRIVETVEATWRRIRLVPFAVTIPAEERDKQLLEKLQHELPGILAWAVRGCLDWQRDGLGEPKEVSAATEDYRREMDSLADFIEDRCFVGDRESVDAGLLYDVFKTWCEQNGEETLTQKRFGTELRERGFEPGKKRGQRCWFGIRLQRDGYVD